MNLKFIFLSFVLILCFSPVQAQWTDGGSFLNTSDNVNIGTSYNAYSLYVRKNQTAWQGRFTNRSGPGADIYLAHGAGYGMFIRGRTDDSKYTLQLNNINGATNIFRNDGRVSLGLLGHVGIGTLGPTHKLTVAGDSKINGALFANYVEAPSGTSKFGQLIAFALQAEEFYADESHLQFLETESLTVSDLGGHSGNQMMVVNSSGQVNKAVIPNSIANLSLGNGVTGGLVGDNLYMSAQTTMPLWNANKLNGRSITAAAPLNGQTMVFNSGNAKWQYTTPANGDVTQVNAGVGLTGGGSTGSLTLNAQTASAIWNANKLQGRTVANTAPSIGQVLKYNGSNWAPADDNSGGGSSVWDAPLNKVQTIFGSNANVEFNNYGSDVALRLGRQDGSSAWWISHRGPTGAGLDEELEFVHHTPAAGYYNPMRIKRGGIVIRKMELFDPGFDEGFDFKVLDANGSPGIPILKLATQTRHADVLTILQNGNLDLEAVPPGNNAEGAKITLNGSGGIVFEARHNQNIAFKGGNACIQGRLEIKGTGDCPPDYVFADDYDLRSIEELAHFIEKEHHLPGVKSEEAFINSGFDVVADSYSFLEKIEELTLYTIDQQNQIKDLKAALKKQQSETAELKALIAKVLQK